jgi:YfiR/HmsC-like
VDTLIDNSAIFPQLPSSLFAHKTNNRTAPARPQLWPSPQWLVLLILLLAGATLPSSAQQRPTESQVKAAYLFNFGKFVTWPDKPATNSDSLEICVLGQDPFGATLDATVEGESIDGKKITVKRLSKLQDGPECRILFVSSSEQKRLRPILAIAQEFGMLTVSGIPGFVQQGGIIQFITQQDRIRFAVNLVAAGKAHLILSSQLLKVASQVVDASAPPNQP